MSGTRDVGLLPRRSGPYRHAMPRAPKDFTVRTIKILDGSLRPKRIALDVAVPEEFNAQAELEGLPLLVTFRVVVGVGGQPQIKELHLKATEGATVTTSGLHRVLVDQLIKAAVAEASKQVRPRPDVGPGAFEVPDPDAWDAAFPAPGGVPHARPIVVVDVEESLPTGTRQQRQDERARQAAKIYAAAVNSGSRAPGDAVATEMGYSRSQAARYIKRARELGILPPADAKDGAA
jgi:hypothetical protein